MRTVAWYERLKADPKAKALLADMMARSEAGKSVSLNELAEMIFEPISEEHQRHQAIFAGEIKPGEPYLMPMTEAQQLLQLKINIWRYINWRLMERTKKEGQSAPARSARSTRTHGTTPAMLFDASIVYRSGKAVDASANEEVRLLEAAKNLIADPTRWCQGNLAEDVAGRSGGDPDHGELIRFSAVGAHRFVTGRSLNEYDFDDPPYGTRAISPHLVAAAYSMRAKKDLPPGWKPSPVEWINEHFGHRAVMKMYDRAIAIAAGQQECGVYSNNGKGDRC